MPQRPLHAFWFLPAFRAHLGLLDKLYRVVVSDHGLVEREAAEVSLHAHLELALVCRVP